MTGRVFSVIPFVLVICFIFVAQPVQGEEKPCVIPPKNPSITDDGTEPKGVLVPKAPKPLSDWKKGLIEDRMNGKPVKGLSNGLKGESACGISRVESLSYGGVGDPNLSGPQKKETPFMNPMVFGNDVKVRPSNLTTREHKPAMCSDSNGVIYVVFEDTYNSKQYAQVYKSSTAGNSWTAFGYVANSSADLTNPSIAVGEGSSDNVLITYIMDDGVNTPVPEVAVSNLAGGGFTVSASIPVYSWEGYDKPVIVTDSVHFNGWIAYLTCEGIFNSAANNINVCAWRSTDYGATWDTGTVPYGNTDPEPWIDPDITYGTTQYRVGIVCYNDLNDILHTNTSDDWAATWNGDVPFYTLSPEPIFDVDPEIAAAINNDNIMICCTRSYNSSDVAGQGYSQDGGDTWSTCWVMNGASYAVHEWSVSLQANQGGGDWHMVYTGNHQVCYNKRPQDLSAYWQSRPRIADDLGIASGTYPKKGIASTWNSDVPVTIWADYRDGTPDYDLYADTWGNYGLCADNYNIEMSVGGYANFYLDAGPANGNRPYMIFGSVTGTEPGTSIPPTGIVLPLNWDIFTNLVIKLANSPLFSNFYGTLNNMGQAMGTMTLTPLTITSVYHLNFAYLLDVPTIDYASNPIHIRIVP